MDNISAYREVGSHRGAAEISGTTTEDCEAGYRAARGRRRHTAAVAAGPEL
jgi:hypothetical protein